jgi:hypothetical protein
MSAKDTDGFGLPGAILQLAARLWATTKMKRVSSSAVSPSPMPLLSSPAWVSALSPRISKSYARTSPRALVEGGKSRGKNRILCYRHAQVTLIQGPDGGQPKFWWRSRWNTRKASAVTRMRTITACMLCTGQ